MLSSQKTLQDLDLSKLPTTLESSSLLFRIPVEDRNDDENEAVVSLLSEVPYLQEISQTADKPNQFLLETSKLFQHEIYSKGQVIGHCGDNPRKFWVILKGDVRIYTPKALEDYFSQGTDEVLNDISPILSKYPESTKGSLFNLDSPLLGSISPMSPMSRTNTKFLLEKKSTIFFETPSGYNSPARRLSDASSVAFEGRKSPAKQGTKQVFFDFGGSIIEEETKDLSRLGGRVRRPARLTASSSTVPPQIEEFGVFKKLNMNKKYFTSEDVFKFQFEKVIKSGNCFADLETDPYLPLPATLMAWEEVHVISMPMKNYTKQLRKLNRVLTENLNILDRLFPELPERVLLPLATSLGKKTFHKGDIIYQEGSKSSDLYIIQQGEIELIKNVMKDSFQSSPKLKPREGKRRILLLSDNQIFGEESVLDHGSNQFTARVRSLELTVYVIPKTLVEKTAKRSEHFLPAISQKAMASFKVKWMRESEMPKETQVVNKIFENPTKQEKKDKQYVKNALDYYTRLLLQEKSPKGNVSSSHIRSGGRESPTRLSPEHSQELQKLADLKTKMIRNKVKVDPRFELEESSPTFQAKRREADEKILKSAASKPSLSKFENQTPISLWNRGLEGSMFLKRVKAMQASRKIRDNKSMRLSHDYGQAKSSPFHSRAASISGPMKTKMKGEESQAAEVPVHNMMNIESLVTSEHTGDSLIIEGIEKTIKKEIDNMISSKLSENKKEPKVKPDKIKKGLACLQPEREVSFQLKGWDTSESDDKSFVPLGNGIVKFALNSPKQGVQVNFEINKGNRKSKLMKGFRESNNNRKSMPALAEYFKGSVYDNSNKKNFEESVLSLKKMESTPTRRMLLPSGIQVDRDREGRQAVLPTILTVNGLGRVKSKSPVVPQRNK